MNQVLFRVEKSMELLSNRVWDPFSSRIDGKIKDLLEGLRSKMEGERELLLYFERAELRKKRRIFGRKGKGIYIPASPQQSLKLQILLGRNGKGIYIPSPQRTPHPRGWER